MTKRDNAYMENPSGDWSSIGRSASSPGEELPDERIRQDICDRLMQAGGSGCIDIGVDVEDGVVTLSGDVSNDFSREQAEQLARSVAGVRDVQNKLKVKST